MYPKAHSNIVGNTKVFGGGELSMPKDKEGINREIYPKEYHTAISWMNLRDPILSEKVSEDHIEHGSLLKKV